MYNLPVICFVSKKFGGIVSSKISNGPPQFFLYDLLRNMQFLKRTAICCMTEVQDKGVSNID